MWLGKYKKGRQGKSQRGQSEDKVIEKITPIMMDCS